MGMLSRKGPLFIGFSLLLLMIGFQNCADTKFKAADTPIQETSTPATANEPPVLMMESSTPSSPPQMACRGLTAIGSAPSVKCDSDEFMTQCVTTNMPSGAAHCFNYPQGSTLGASCIAHCDSSQTWRVSAICCKIGS